MSLPLFPFIFFKFNVEQTYFPKNQNIKKTKCMPKYYIETKNFCSKTNYSETSFLIQKQTTGKRIGCSVSKANIYHWARKECWLKMLPTITLMLPSSLASGSLAGAAIIVTLGIEFAP